MDNRRICLNISHSTSNSKKNHRSFYLVKNNNTTGYKDEAIKLLIKLGVFLLMIQNSIVAHAAGPIMHAYLGLRWIETNGTEFDSDEKRAFILGTLFPDIRYLADIPREKTHFDVKTLAQVRKGKNAFEQGMRFHSYVDHKRTQYYHTHKIYAESRKLPKKHREIFIKLVEDQITYKMNAKEEWDTIKSYLSEIIKEEENWVDRATLTKWHLGLTFYFNTLPSTLLSQISMFRQGVLMLEADTISEWSYSVKNVAGDPRYQAYVQDLIGSFE